MFRKVAPGHLVHSFQTPEGHKVEVNAQADQYASGRMTKDYNLSFNVNHMQRPVGANPHAVTRGVIRSVDHLVTNHKPKKLKFSAWIDDDNVDHSDPAQHGAWENAMKAKDAHYEKFANGIARRHGGRYQRKGLEHTVVL